MLGDQDHLRVDMNIMRTVVLYHTMVDFFDLPAVWQCHICAASRPNQWRLNDADYKMIFDHIYQQRKRHDLYLTSILTHVVAL